LKTYSVTKSFRFPSGHRLSKHKGLCQFFHGHNVRVDVCISSPELNENDMVMDFKDLKIMVEEVIKDWDHCLFLSKDDKKFAKLMTQASMRVILLDRDPTAENLAEVLYYKLKEKVENFNKIMKASLNLETVSIWENDDSVASFIE